MKLTYTVQIRPEVPTEIEVVVEVPEEADSYERVNLIEETVKGKVRQLTVPMVALSWQLKSIL